MNFERQPDPMSKLSVYHRLTKRQIKKFLSSDYQSLDDQHLGLEAFIQSVDQAYQQADEDRALLERSVELTSQELKERNQELQQQITELKATQVALKESHSLLQASLASSHEAILVLDLLGNIRLYNPNFSRMFHVDMEEQEISNLNDLLAKADLLIPPPNSFSLEVLRSLSEPKHQSICEFKTRFGRTIEANSNPQKKSSEIVGQVWSFRDISELKLKEEEARHRAYHDLLTGLPNRRLLANRLNEALLTAKNSTLLTIVLFIDLDGFKDVNDSLGHGVGDALLKAITGRLEALLPSGSLLSRHGGDEFIAVMEKQQNSKVAQEFAKSIVDSFSIPFQLADEAIYMSASIGISISPIHGRTAEKLISHADTAMYQAKKRGKNTFVIYDEQLNNQPAYRLKLRNQINVALENEQFELYFQPKICLDTGMVKGAEALIRWRLEDGKFRSPLEFIPIAEDNGQIIPISQWVIHKCCEYLQRWKDDLDDDFVLALNISARHFHRGLLQEDLAMSLGKYSIDPCKLELEVTETAIMDDLDLAVQTLNELKKMGIRTAIDDFGTGHSSLSYLRKLPIEILKIDKSFIDEILISYEDRTLVRGIIEMVHALGIEVVAEGVENHQMATLLQEMQCDLVQGYHYCPPIPADDFLKIIQNRQCYI
ncbi:MAG: diguanylate cyclase (GGDEF)-like protein/PAS domain S-box-containing protein [Oleiphilaceae bacterium]